MTPVNFSNLVTNCVVLRAEPAASHGHLSSKENCKSKHTLSCGIPGIRKGWSCNHFPREERYRALLTSHSWWEGIIIFYWGSGTWKQNWSALPGPIFLCNFIDSYCVTELPLCCSHKPLTSRFLPVLLFLIQNPERYILSIICLTLESKRIVS